MEIADFLRLVAGQIEKALAKNDTAEVLRLLELLKRTCEEQIAANS